MNQKILTFLVIWQCCRLAAANPPTDFDPNNFLVSTNGVLYEYTPAGTLVRNISILRPPGSGERARDLVRDSKGRIHFYNGTFEPSLSTFDPQTSTWEHRSIPGWGTVNNSSYGGIASYQDYVFLTDMETENSIESLAHGLIRYDLASNSYTRFATTLDPIDLTIGLDGLLYALSPGGSPGGLNVAVYNPDTLGFVRNISLSGIFGHTEHRAIAVDADSTLFIVDQDGDLQKVNAAGSLLGSTRVLRTTTGSPTSAQLFDVDLNSAGELLLGSRFGEIFYYDKNLNYLGDIDVPGTGETFVSFAALPEPSTWLLLAFLPALLIHTKGVFHRRLVS